MGKWYKANTYGYYGKFLRIGNALNWYFITSERISSSGYLGNEYGFNNDKKWELLTDLSEIQDYLPEGHPDKIVKPKSLVGRYLKALVDNAESTRIDKGEYALITEGYSNITRVKDGRSNFIYSSHKIGETWELMPEGFEPPKETVKEEWVPKVGDWVVSLENKGNYRKKGDVFQVLEVDSNSIYYKKDTNGYINTFRPAEPHEIPLTVMEYKEPPTKVKPKYNSEEVKIQIKKSNTIKI